VIVPECSNNATDDDRVLARPGVGRQQGNLSQIPPQAVRPFASAAVVGMEECIGHDLPRAAEGGVVMSSTFSSPDLSVDHGKERSLLASAKDAICPLSHKAGSDLFVRDNSLI